MTTIFDVCIYLGTVVGSYAHTWLMILLTIVGVGIGFVLPRGTFGAESLLLIYVLLTSPFLIAAWITHGMIRNWLDGMFEWFLG
jgi:phosphatidylglycerophosphate synthase